MTDTDFRAAVQDYYEVVRLSAFLTITGGAVLVWAPYYFGNSVVFPAIIGSLILIMWACIFQEMHANKGTKDWYITLEYMFCKNKYSVLEPGRNYLLQGFDVQVHLIPYGRDIYGVSLKDKDGDIPHDIHPYYQHLLATILLEGSTKKPTSQVENALKVLTRSSTYPRN